MEQGRIADLGDGAPAGLAELVTPQIRVSGGEERVDPAVMNFIMQAAQASHLAKLRKLEESKIPTGDISLEVAISSRTIWRFEDPLIAFSLTNDGDPSIYVTMNSGGPLASSATLKVDEIWNYDGDFPYVNYLTLEPVSGSPTIRLRARTGKRVEGITPPLILDAEAI